MLRAIRWSGGLKHTLLRLVGASQDLSAPLRIFGAYMLRSITKNFRQGGRRNGMSGAWRKLSPVTIAMRPKGQRASPKILIRSARLRNSTAFAVDRRRLAVGTNVRYAPLHHQGGRWGGAIRVTEARKIPAYKRMAWVRAGAPSVSRFVPKARLAFRLSVSRVVATSRVRTYRPSRAPASPKAASARAGLVRRAVMVRAHTEHRTSTIPARPIYGFQPEDYQRWQTILKGWFRQQTTGKVA